MPKDDADLEQFKRDRRKALLSMDKTKILRYADKYGAKLPENDTVFWVAIHKARTGCLDLPMKERKKSAKWLRSRGFHTMDDGELSD